MAHDRRSAGRPAKIQPSGLKDPVSAVETYQAALQHHQAGQLPQAIALYRQLLAQLPDHADGLFALGLALYESGEAAPGFEAVHRAIALNPTAASYHYTHALLLKDQSRSLEALDAADRAFSLAATDFETLASLESLYLELSGDLQAQGHLSEAARGCEQALAVNPQSAEAHNNLGNLRAQQGKAAEAVEHYQRALALAPRLMEAVYNLGNAFKALGRLQMAVLYYRQALVLQPDLPQAHYQLGSVLIELQDWPGAEASLGRAIALSPTWAEPHFQLGWVLDQKNQRPEAIASYRRSLALDPNLAEACNNLAILLEADLTVDLEDIAALFRRAIACKPDWADPHYNLGRILVFQSRFAEAEASYGRALALRPDWSTAHVGLASCLLEQGQLPVAIASYRQAIACNPEDAQAHALLGCALLLGGDWQAGWPEYQWYRRSAGLVGEIPVFDRPRWDGSALAGRTILLFCEQGIGDAIQFVRYAQLLKAMQASVVVQCAAALKRLLAPCPAIDVLVGYGEALPPFDVHVLQFDLPLLLDTRIDGVPVQQPYLTPPVQNDLPDALQETLAAVEAARIGIVWSPKSQFRGDQKRYCPLAHFEPLLALPGFRFFSLYKGERLGELEPYRERIVDLGSHFRDFADTAWAIDQLDLVIAVDTAVAHLAGAMGKPVWILLPYLPDWRWQLGREDSPWYPTARLFRQPVPGDWPALIDQVVGRLKNR
ncbi:tetratricopeptide repeat protein [Gloeobacter kilaueensis]|uniref:TPR repeat-containing protein n=1 Tax=Gloeobacter kilaueensis (strain ATCC BAA-2537 / CCAP 1431/1 / ULC 316 / JS1) TaxID=1183438 RepID=U5QJI3_GLOK1|nr:tetratricopeptide repeat protein [Gloeobacter kilaueensis]AGY59043.1 TPR repeat-containing protein [Gloeobacter kilaueensis JS1]